MKMERKRGGIEESQGGNYENLASRAAFFARLHRGLSLEEWLNRVIQERLDIEEAAFSGFKLELAAKNG